MKKLMMVMMVAVMMVAVSGCRTFKGAMEDVSGASAQIALWCEPMVENTEDNDAEVKATSLDKHYARMQARKALKQK